MPNFETKVLEITKDTLPVSTKHFKAPFYAFITIYWFKILLFTTEQLVVGPRSDRPAMNRPRCHFAWRQMILKWLYLRQKLHCWFMAGQRFKLRCAAHPQLLQRSSFLTIQIVVVIVENANNHWRSWRIVLHRKVCTILKTIGVCHPRTSSIPTRWRYAISHLLEGDYLSEGSATLSSPFEWPQLTTLNHSVEQVFVYLAAS